MALCNRCKEREADTGDFKNFNLCIECIRTIEDTTGTIIQPIELSDGTKHYLFISKPKICQLSDIHNLYYMDGQTHN